MRAIATIGTSLLAAALVVSGCGGQTEFARNVTAHSADLWATAHCDSGESCTWYWEYWPASGPRSASTKTAVQGPVSGSTGDVRLMQHIAGLQPGTTYRWVFCGSPSNGKPGTYACVGPSGHPFSTTADPPPDPATLITHKTWAIQPTPNPSGATQAQLGAVSCTSSTACMAGGSYTNSAKVSVTLAESWDGTSWTIRSTPNPAGATGNALSGVSCTSSTACTAVGSYTDSTGKILPLAERWNGTSWAMQTTPNPSGAAKAELHAVSCASSTACVAVGSSSSGSLAEHWDGAHWTIQPSSGSLLNGVSCTSTTACTAVGEQGTDTLAERWNGTNWTVQSTPTFPSTDVPLNGVSCTSATRCLAVGWYVYPGPRLHPFPHFPFSETWDGSAWTDQSMEQPSGDDLPQGVSCTSATACAAVGHSEDYNYAHSPLAEHWDGSAWTVQDTPGGSGAGLSGVSCTSDTACTAVGSHLDGTGQQVTLAERFSG